MKILYFNYLYDIHGASLGSAIKPMELFSELEKQGHRIKLCWRKRQPGCESGLISGFRTVLKTKFAKYIHDPKQFLSNFKNLLQEWKIVNDFRPDLLISRLDLYLFSALVISRLKKIPLVIEGDCPAFYEAATFQPQYRRISIIPRVIEFLNLRVADAVVVVSKALKRYFVNQGILPQKTFVVTNGADPGKFSPELKHEQIVSKYNLKDSLVLGFIGSFSSWHGVENLIQLIEGIIQDYPNVKFLLVGGGGNMKGELEEYIREKNLGNQVILTGYVPHSEIPSYVSAMDLVLAPYSRLEFFYYSPVKIFEYMASAKPVVTTPIGQISEIIVDNLNGVLCEPDDLRGTIGRVSQLLSNSQLRMRIGDEARRTILEHHTWREKASQWARICENVRGS